MNVVESRFHQLINTAQQRSLTKKEQQEIDECVTYLHHRAWKKALLQNYSLMASMTEDVEWQFEICAEIECLN